MHIWVVEKADTRSYFFYFSDKFGNNTPILTIFSLLQQEMYDA